MAVSPSNVIKNVLNQNYFIKHLFYFSLKKGLSKTDILSRS